MLHKFVLNGVVSLIDAVNGGYVIDRFCEAKRQVAVADLMVVTKGDLAKDPVSKKELEQLKLSLNQINPNAKVLDVDDASAAPIFSLAAFDPSGKEPDVKSWLDFDPEPHGGHQHTHEDAATAYCFLAVVPVDNVQLNLALSALQGAFGVNLLRVKGLVNIIGYSDSPRVVHIVGHIASPMKILDGWPDGIESTRMVVIVSGGDRDAVPNLLNRYVPELSVFKTIIDEMCP